MAVRGTADGLVPVGAAMRRRGLCVESRRWNKAATGHHGRICEYTLVSLMLASEGMKRNKQSQFRGSTLRRGWLGSLIGYGRLSHGATRVDEYSGRVYGVVGGGSGR